MRIVLYGNGGSGNHGCEAIVRGTYETLNIPMILAAEAMEEEKRYGLDDICTLEEAKTENVSKFQTAKAYIKLKLTGDFTDLDGFPYLPFIKRAGKLADFALSVGGDNYCYSNQPFYAYLNRAYRKSGLKTVLWGCSIEPEVIRNKKVAEDLRGYHLIVARESITYNALKDVGIDAILAPDPAFFMKPLKWDMDERFIRSEVVGINVSPMILSHEKCTGMAYENFKNLIHYILDETEFYVALIPHVVWKENDDRAVLYRLYEEFSCDKRLIMIEDHTAPELKYIISKCRFFVGARTHATIAAYSSAVPTLAVGYSVKARGIAVDLFGTQENYVVPVQSLESDGQLTESFKWLMENENKIRQHLTEFLPGYREKGPELKEALLRDER